MRTIVVRGDESKEMIKKKITALEKKDYSVTIVKNSIKPPGRLRWNERCTGLWFWIHNLLALGLPIIFRGEPIGWVLSVFCISCALILYASPEKRQAVPEATGRVCFDDVDDRPEIFEDMDRGNINSGYIGTLASFNDDESTDSMRGNPCSLSLGLGPFTGDD